MKYEGGAGEYVSGREGRVLLEYSQRPERDDGTGRARAACRGGLCKGEGIEGGGKTFCFAARCFLRAGSGGNEKTTREGGADSIQPTGEGVAMATTLRHAMPSERHKYSLGYGVSACGLPRPASTTRLNLVRLDSLFYCDTPAVLAQLKVGGGGG